MISRTDDKTVAKMEQKDNQRVDSLNKPLN